MKRAALIILCIQGAFGALAQDVVIPKDTSNIQKIGIYYVDTSKYYVTNQLSSFAVFVKGYEFWEKEDWVNYKKHFPDSCTAIYPFVEDVSILKAKLMKMH